MKPTARLAARSPLFGISADCFSPAEFAAGFDAPVSFMHGPQGPRLRVALADVAHDLTAASTTLCAFTRSLAEMMAQLDASPLGRALLARAVEDGVTIGQDTLMAPGASYYYPDRGHIDLGRQDAALELTEKGLSQYMAGFVAALRRHWQDAHGHAPSYALRPADYADHHRLMEADMQAVLQHVAWELRGQGHTYLWRGLLAAEDGDITGAFEAAVLAESGSQFDGRALKAAFNQWFAVDARIAAADHRALEALDTALVRGHGTAARAQFATAALVRADLARLGILPDGGNYLAGCVFTNAWYQGFTDEANRRHLTHIEQEIRQLAVFSA